MGLVPASSDSVMFTPQAVYSALDASGLALRADSPQRFDIALPAGPNGVLTDCVGNGPLAAGTLIMVFEWRNQQLVCRSNGAEQVLLDGVAQWVVDYGVRDAAGAVQYRAFASDIPWANVDALRICVVLVSQAPVPEFAEIFRAAPGLAWPDCEGGDLAPDVLADQRLRRRYAHVFALRPGQP